MTHAIDLWHAEHVDYARLLDVLKEQVDAFRAQEAPKYGLMRDVVTYLRGFPDRYHHPREDVAFARLVRHAPALQVPVNRLLQEHRVIAAAGEELLERLNEAVEGRPVGRAVLEAAADMYLVYYRHHLSFEEREILPRAAQLLTADDLADVAGAASLIPDPLFGDRVDARYRELRERIATQTGIT